MQANRNRSKLKARVHAVIHFFAIECVRCGSRKWKNGMDSTAENETQ